MKLLFLIVSFTLIFLTRSPAEWTEEFRRIEAEQVALWERKLNEAKGAAPEERPALLWLGLRNMGHRNSLDGRSYELQDIYKKIRDELISISAHARYFADEIRREQKEVAKYPTSTGPRISYDFNRSKYFVTMSHLPSPETIAVLGEFLSDDIDTPRRKISPHSDWGESPRANSFGASVTIAAIGLRDAPADKKSYEDDPDAHLAKTRAWWEEVKSGQRTFSFKGQVVEYRFRPDGTWETIPIANPPDDGPKPAPAAPDSEIQTPPSDMIDSVKPDERSLWWWIAGTAGVLLALAPAFVRKFRRTA